MASPQGPPIAPSKHATLNSTYGEQVHREFTGPHVVCRADNPHNNRPCFPVHVFVS